MKYLIAPIKFLIKLPVYFYKYLISPMLPSVCRFTPSCSNYFLMAVNEFGPIKGFGYGVKRILRCRPGSKSHGYDPVPINIKGEGKWLF